MKGVKLAQKALILFGGNYTAVLNLTTTIPEFGANLETIDFQIFFDAANVWGVDYDSSLDNSQFEILCRLKCRLVYDCRST